MKSEERAEELLPCPFCGAVPVIDVFKDEEEMDEGRFTFFIECRARDCHRLVSIGHASTRAEAIAAWNRRAPSPSKPGVPEGGAQAPVPRGHCNRCDRCGWDLVAKGGLGCWAANCSVRPMPPPSTHCHGCGAPYAEAMRALPAPGVPEGDQFSALEGVCQPDPRLSTKPGFVNQPGVPEGWVPAAGWTEAQRRKNEADFGPPAPSDSHPPAGAGSGDAPSLVDELAGALREIRDRVSLRPHRVAAIDALLARYDGAPLLVEQRTWQQERAAVVAWHRGQVELCLDVAKACLAPGGTGEAVHARWRNLAEQHRKDANLIERGDHIPPAAGGKGEG
jgi:hypothetical protein